jgi:hypothetical protein
LDEGFPVDDPAVRQAKVNDAITDISVSTPISSGGFGFPGARVISACMRPYKCDRIVWGGMSVELCAKVAGEWIDLVGINTTNEPWKIIFALQVFPDLWDTPVDHPPPLQIVAQMVERFGLPLTIGDLTGRLYLGQEVLIPPGAHLDSNALSMIEVDNPDRHSCLPVLVATRTDPTIQIALSFCIDHWRYHEWIGGR